MRGVSMFRVLLLTLVIFTATDALAQDDRSTQDPTGWWWLHGVTEAQITDLINDEGARLVDLEVESSSPLRFSAAFVRNSGSYARAWWWLFGQTTADITTFLGNTPGARIIDVERYLVSGNERFAVVMVDDGADAPAAWWWYVGQTAADITNLINLNNMRLIDIEEYDVGGNQRYAVVGVRNTGSWARTWWWWLGADETFLNNFIGANNARILDINIDPSAGAPFFNAILVQNTGPNVAWWWYYGVTASQLPALYDQNGARIADIEPYQNAVGGKVFNVMMLCNLNDLEKSIASQLQWGADGATGFYLKEVGGPVLAQLQPWYIFEPASTIKVIHNFHAMRQVELGATNLGVNLNYSVNYNGSCPIGGAPFTNQSLSGTLADMMQLSDNAATQGIDIFFGGDGPIESTAQLIAGMVDTQLNHTLGCGAQQLVSPNRLTLLDAAALYEGVANGTLLNDREQFYDHMQSEETAAPWWFTTDIRDIIFTEAANLGIPDAGASYWAETELAWKPGGYDIFDGALNPHMYRSVAGWVSLPECGGRAGLVHNEYVFGLFIDDAASSAFADSRLFGVSKELFRELIRDGLLSCPTSVPETPMVAQGRMLGPNHPNPFNPSTSLSYRLDAAGPMRLSIVDVRGHEVVVLVDEHKAAGPHQLSWNGRDATGRSVASGVYFARLAFGGAVETQKMALLK